MVYSNGSAVKGGCVSLLLLMQKVTTLTGTGTSSIPFLKLEDAVFRRSMSVARCLPGIGPSLKIDVTKDLVYNMIDQ